MHNIVIYFAPRFVQKYKDAAKKKTRPDSRKKYKDAAQKDDGEDRRQKLCIFLYVFTFKSRKR